MAPRNNTPLLPFCVKSQKYLINQPSPLLALICLYCFALGFFPFRCGVSFSPGVEEMKCPLCCTYRRQHTVHTSDAIPVDIQVRTAVTAECL